MSPGPRRLRRRIHPQSLALFASVLLCAGVEHSIFGSLLAFVSLVVPGKSSDEHSQIDISSLQKHFPNAAAVLVGLLRLNVDLLIRHQGCKKLLCAMTKGLPALGCVYASKADFVLPHLRVKNGDGVAIRDAYYLSGDDLSMRPLGCYQ